MSCQRLRCACPQAVKDLRCTMADHDPREGSDTHDNIGNVALRWKRHIDIGELKMYPLFLCHVGVWNFADKAPAVRAVVLRKGMWLSKLLLRDWPDAKLVSSWMARWVEETPREQQDEINSRLRRPCPLPARPLGPIGVAFPADLHCLYLKATTNLKSLREMRRP